MNPRFVRKHKYKIVIALAVVVVFLLNRIVDIVTRARYNYYQPIPLRNPYKKKLLISVIIPTYNFDDKKLARAIKSVEKQAAVPPLVNFVVHSEVIVVNDGSSESHFNDFANGCKRLHPVSDLKHHADYDCMAGVHTVRFVSNPINEGLGGARNFGIQYARGKWILPLDADDELHPNYFGQVLVALHSKSPLLSLHNPGSVNVIMPYMMNFKGKHFGWQPSQNTTLIKERNVFHCCGMYLKSIWDSGIQYDKMMIYGWEDWDFWIKLEYEIGIEAIVIEKPLYKYNIGEEENGSDSHLSKFCIKNFELCVAHLHLNNPCYYDKYDVRQSYEFVRRFISNRINIPKWELVKREYEKGDSFAQLLVETKSSSKSLSRSIFMDYYESSCPDVNQLCDFAVDRLAELAKIQEKMDEMILFHLIVTKVTSTELWTRMLRHVVVGILDFNAKSTLFVHSNLKIEDIFDAKFLSFYSDRIVVSPILCHTVIAEKYGVSSVGRFINRYGNGRPNYYSHFTDYLRVLLLYSFGGIYMDTDILLRQSVSHLHNVAAREDHEYVNGAFLSFDRFSPVMLYCLQQIPLVYDAFVWNTIGPALMTQVSKMPNFTTSSGDAAGSRVQLNVLAKESFYDINWKSVDGLTGDSVSLADYEGRGQVNLGYHFWGKIFFGVENMSVAESSILGFALQRTCRPSIMKCVELTSDW